MKKQMPKQATKKDLQIITKERLNQAYSINRAINRLYFEKQKPSPEKYSAYVLRQKINELENELEQFPFHLQLRVKEMLDSRDFNHDLYEHARWITKRAKLEYRRDSKFSYEQIVNFGRFVNARQLGINPSVFDGIPF